MANNKTKLRPQGGSPGHTTDQASDRVHVSPSKKDADPSFTEDKKATILGDFESLSFEEQLDLLPEFTVTKKLTGTMDFTLKVSWKP